MLTYADVCLGTQVKWAYMVVDEGHRLKNKDRYYACQQLVKHVSS
jgi:SNF2 family DNA or RNA helicase